MPVCSSGPSWPLLWGTPNASSGNPRLSANIHLPLKLSSAPLTKPPLRYTETRGFVLSFLRLSLLALTCRPAFGGRRRVAAACPAPALPPESPSATLRASRSITDSCLPAGPRGSQVPAPAAGAPCSSDWLRKLTLYLLSMRRWSGASLSTWAANGDLSLVLGWRRPGSSLGSGPPPASGTGTSLATQPAVSMRNESHACPAFRLDGADALILVQLQAKSGTAAFFTESRLSWLPSGRLYVREGSRLLLQA